jgi:hypothetical protein
MSLILSGTDGLSDVDGSAATPAIRGTDANTGIFFPAADTIAFSEGGVESMRIDSSGRVGIGITSPSVPLHIQADSSGNSTRVQGRSSDGYADMSLYNNANTVNNAFFSSSNTATFLGTGTTIPLTFQTNATERMRIDSSGNLLVGTTSASGRFTLKGAGATNATSAIYITNSTPAYTFVVNDDGTIYTGATPAGAPYNNNIGAVRTLMVNSAGNLGYNASTRNTKINITPLTNINWLFNLEPVSFNYREKDNEGNYTDVAKPDVHYGLIAEDTETVNKELCFYNADDSLAGVNYNMLAPALLKAIQEQQALILSLTARITALETP